MTLQSTEDSGEKPFGWIKQSEIEQAKRFGGSINLWLQKYDCDTPVFMETPKLENKMKHPHCDMIIEWAKDTSRVVQYQDNTGEWLDIKLPSWSASTQYRFKPEPKPDIVIERIVDYVSQTLSARTRVPEHYEMPNVIFTFDGDTHKLKSVEMKK